MDRLLGSGVSGATQLFTTVCGAKNATGSRWSPWNARMLVLVRGLPAVFQKVLLSVNLALSASSPCAQHAHT